MISLLFTKEVIQKIKSSTVGIGIIDKDNNGIVLLGSGFLFDSEGYVATAAHVLIPAMKHASTMNKFGRKIEVVMLRLEVNETTLVCKPEELHDFVYADQTDSQDDYELPLQENFDVAVAKVKEKFVASYPYLNIKTSPKYEIFDEVAICGYPQGGQSLRFIATNELGQRFSPIIQSGKIASVLPFDTVPQPYGIQTDIIGTGGSSGSCITNNNGEVIGMALKVISSKGTSKVPPDILLVPDETKGFKKNEGILKFPVESNVGLVYGYSSFLLVSFIEDMRTYYKTGKRKETGEFSITKLGGTPN